MEAFCMTQSEEAFLHTWLRESKQRWVNGDLARGWLIRALRQIAEQRQEIDRLKGIVEGLAERVGKQSEVITGMVERTKE